MQQKLNRARKNCDDDTGMFFPNNESRLSKLHRSQYGSESRRQNDADPDISMRSVHADPENQTKTVKHF